jgi:hypothetical protein
MRFADGAAETTMYGHKEGQYAYGSDLFVYNVPEKTLTNLPSKDAANAYLRAVNPGGDGGCPHARERDEAKVF